MEKHPNYEKMHSVRYRTPHGFWIGHTFSSPCEINEKKPLFVKVYIPESEDLDGEGYTRYNYNNFAIIRWISTVDIVHINPPKSTPTNVSRDVNGNIYSID